MNAGLEATKEQRDKILSRSSVSKRYSGVSESASVLAEDSKVELAQGMCQEFESKVESEAHNNLTADRVEILQLRSENLELRRICQQLQDAVSRTSNEISVRLVVLSFVNRIGFQTSIYKLWNDVFLQQRNLDISGDVPIYDVHICGTERQLSARSTAAQSGPHTPPKLLPPLQRKDSLGPPSSADYPFPNPSVQPHPLPPPTPRSVRTAATSRPGGGPIRAPVIGPPALPPGTPRIPRTPRPIGAAEAAAAAAAAAAAVAAERQSAVEGFAALVVPDEGRRRQFVSAMSRRAGTASGTRASRERRAAAGGAGGGRAEAGPAEPGAFSLFYLPQRKPFPPEGLWPGWPGLKRQVDGPRVPPPSRAAHATRRTTSRRPLSRLALLRLPLLRRGTSLLLLLLRPRIRHAPRARCKSRPHAEARPRPPRNLRENSGTRRVASEPPP